jgi:hypothetical protein
LILFIELVFLLLADFRQLLEGEALLFHMLQIL